MSVRLVHAGEWRRVADFTAPWPAFVIAASKRVLDEGAPWLAPLLAHVRDECDRAARDRAKSTARIADAYSIPAADVAEWLEQTRWSCELGVDRATLQGVVDVLATAGLVAPSTAPAALVAPTG